MKTYGRNISPTLSVSKSIAEGASMMSNRGTTTHDISLSLKVYLDSSLNNAIRVYGLVSVVATIISIPTLRTAAIVLINVIPKGSFLVPKVRQAAGVDSPLNLGLTATAEEVQLDYLDLV
jgi:hypothetical protein